MFTGIITEVGQITDVKKGNVSSFTVKTSSILQNKKIGESIAVNGVCVTITSQNDSKFTFDAIQETLERSNLGDLKTGSPVNLEAALQLNQSLDGHIVQGHVDTVGNISNIQKSGDNTRMTIDFPPEIAKYLAFKGSITINGVSLTISDLQADNFSIDLIPHTLKNTNLGNLQKNDKVNLEVDIIARYLERMIQGKETESKYNFLKERGFI